MNNYTKGDCSGLVPLGIKDKHGKGISEDDVLQFTPKHTDKALPEPFNDIPFDKSFIGHYCWTGANYPIISIIENYRVPPYYGGYLIDDFPFNSFNIEIIGNTRTTPEYMKYNRHLAYVKLRGGNK